MLDHDAPPSVLICHCTVGAGAPLATEIKVIELFWHDPVSIGVFVVISGGTLTVTVNGYELPTHDPVFEVGIILYTTEPAVVVLGLVNV
jgi:hypothetical protein